MVRTIGIALLSLFVGLLIGSVVVHFHHKNLWKKNFESKRFNSPKFDRLPPELVEKAFQTLQSPDSELAAQIEALPFYQHLSLDERSKMMDRLHRFRVKQKELTEKKIQELGLHLSEDQKINFQKSLFEKKKKNMQSLQSKSKEWMEDLEQKSNEELRKEFLK